MAGSRFEMLQKKKAEAERRQKERTALAQAQEGAQEIEAPSTIIDVMDSKEVPDGQKAPEAEAPEEKPAETTTATETEPVVSDKTPEKAGEKAGGKKAKKSFKGKTGRKEDRVITKPKDEVPAEEKNLSVSHTFAIDRDTLTQLAAVVKLMKASGARIDDRVITESSFVRKAIIDEFDVLYQKNGDAFKEAVEREMNKAPELQNFSF